MGRKAKKATVLLDDIDTRMSVAAGTNQDQTRFAHVATVQRPELLGMLITRCSSDSATGKGALGALAYMGSRFISAQIGRVMTPASLVD